MGREVPEGGTKGDRSAVVAGGADADADAAAAAATSADAAGPPASDAPARPAPALHVIVLVSLCCLIR